MTKTRHALIVAGGSGTRMGLDTPKQFLPLLGKPILMHTISVFYSSAPSPKIVLVLPANEHLRWKELCKEFSFDIPHRLISGGETRFHSVKNGLACIEDEGLVAIHDGVRPLVSKNLIEKCFADALSYGNAIPAVKPHETIRIGTHKQSRIENRDLCWLVQTPQVFFLKEIKSCYNTEYNTRFTDDASVAEAKGKEIFIVDGEKENIKITTPLDLIVATAILESRGDQTTR
jgi:2-C-methyl-D-erythritol 4-phosphate cytidylyltransferase